MKHTLRTSIFKILAKLPEDLGSAIYHKIQNFAGKSLGFKLHSTELSLRTIRGILKKYDLSLEGKNIIEMGSGWVPIMPYLLIYEAGAKSVSTYDINEHYQLSEIKKINKIYEEKFNLSSDHFTGKYALPNAIKYFPKTDIGTADFTNTDIVISRFVLEHVPPQIIDSLHATFADKLASGSYVLHMISPNDHRAYTDNSLSLYDFLQYSQADWDNIQTKFDYHNRLRLPQYLDIFRKNFDIIHVEHNFCKPGTKAFDRFKALKIHQDYAGYSDVELTAGSINVLLKKL